MSTASSIPKRGASLSAAGSPSEVASAAVLARHTTLSSSAGTAKESHFLTLNDMTRNLSRQLSRQYTSSARRISFATVSRKSSGATARSLQAGTDDTAPSGATGGRASGRRPPFRPAGRTTEVTLSGGGRPSRAGTGLSSATGRPSGRVGGRSIRPVTNPGGQRLTAMRTSELRRRENLQRDNDRRLVVNRLWPRPIEGEPVAEYACKAYGTPLTSEHPVCVPEQVQGMLATALEVANATASRPSTLVSAKTLADFFGDLSMEPSSCMDQLWQLTYGRGGAAVWSAAIGFPLADHEAVELDNIGLSFGDGWTPETWAEFVLK